MKKSLILATLALVGAATPAFADFPQLTTDDNNPNYYLIKNVRANNYADASSDGTKALLATNKDATSVWYFKAAPDVTNPDGWTAVNIYNLGSGKMITNPESVTWTTNSSEGVWYIKNETHTNSGKTGYAISKAADLKNGYGWNNYQGGGKFIAYYESDDQGSLWDFEAVTEAFWSEASAGIIAGGNVIAGIEGIPSERKTAWETAASTEVNSGQALINITEAYKTLVNDLHLQFGSCKVGCNNDYLSQMNGIPRRWAGGEGSRVFTLKAASNGMGFYVLNEYLQQYIVHPTANNSSASYSSSESNATVYNMDIFNADLKQYGVFSTQSGLNADNLYWHSNGSNELWRWQKDINSSWYISVMSEDQAASECLQGAIDAANAGDERLGSGVGKYTKSEALIQAVAAAESASESDNTAKREAAAAIRAAYNNGGLVINQPTVGYYRFKYGNDYLSSTINPSYSRLAIVSESNPGNLNNTTVFFYDGTYIVSFPEGKVIASITGSGNNNNHNYTCVLSTADNASSSWTFVESGQVGKYFVKSGNRFLYHHPERIDAGDNHDDSNGYCWELVPVTWLPIPHDESKTHFSVCVPADLNIKQEGKAQHHSGEIQGSNFGVTELEGDVLAAHTPALLEYKQGLANGCVYFQIVGYPTVSAQAEVVNQLTNSGDNYWLAKAPEADKTYYVVEGGNLVKFTGDVLPANAAFVVLDTPADEEEALPESFGIADYDPAYTSISEIEGANNGIDAIYDLQGRRVAKAAKGIYIINGKKTLVK